MYNNRYQRDLVGSVCTGRQIKVHEGSMTFAGTIAKIEWARIEKLRLTMAWCAYLNTSDGTWSWWRDYFLLLPKLFEPMQCDGKGEINFKFKSNGRGVIFPKGHIFLRPEDVRNLPEGWERLYAQYPALPLVLETTQLALDSCGIMLSIMDRLAQESTLSDLLKLIPGNILRERFLVSYIRYLKGDLNVHLQY